MKEKITNESLKIFYEEAFKDRDTFFTYPTSDCSEMITLSRDWTGLRVLEIGCGEGDTAVLIANKGGIVTAVDYSESAIKRAKEKYPNSAVTFLNGNWDELIKGFFDVIILQEVIEHIDHPPQILRKIHNRLIDIGELIITCPAFLNPRGYIWMTLQILFKVPMSLSDMHFITPHEMKVWCNESGFEIIEWKTFRFSQAWGHGMTIDMRKRLTNALQDAHMDNSRVDELLEWMELATKYEIPTLHNGAKNYFRLRKT
jgi:2-polyprenyl-3-methyl-5-hydroxy-6-metoxy-1,4-benzoquinol methylase